MVKTELQQSHSVSQHRGLLSWHETGLVTVVTSIHMIITERWLYGLFCYFVALLRLYFSEVNINMMYINKIYTRGQFWIQEMCVRLGKTILYCSTNQDSVDVCEMCLRHLSWFRCIVCVWVWEKEGGTFDLMFSLSHVLNLTLKFISTSVNLAYFFYK